MAVVAVFISFRPVIARYRILLDFPKNFITNHEGNYPNFFTFDDCDGPDVAK